MEFEGLILSTLASSTRTDQRYKSCGIPMNRVIVKKKKFSDESLAAVTVNVKRAGHSRKNWTMLDNSTIFLKITKEKENT